MAQGVREGGEVTEGEIQDAVYLWTSQHTLVLPNCYLFGENESDLVSVTKSGYVWEYEIKVSRRDFLADKRKSRHQWYSGSSFGDCSGWYRRPGTPEPRKPNRFFYVVEEGVANAEDLPEYAGLLVARRNEDGEVYVRREKMAPVLNKERASTELLLRIGSGFSFRYWRFRLQAGEKS